MVVTAIVGSAGLRSTWAALEAGKTVALANKETLVVAGPLVMRLAAETRRQDRCRSTANTAPIFQALQAGRRRKCERIVLTASGGPFRRHTPRAIGPRHGGRAPCGIRPGTWGRKSRSIRPR